MKRVVSNEFRLSPGESLGPFVFGLTISAAFDFVRLNVKDFKKNDFIYNEEDPLSMPYVIRLNTHGLELRFNPRSQRLEEIQVFDIKKISLTYGIEHPVTLSSHAYQPTLNNIHEYVGPTEPGVFSEDGSEYVITYNDAGLQFTFEVPNDVQSDEEGSQSKEGDHIKLKQVLCRAIKKFSPEQQVTVLLGEGIIINSVSPYEDDGFKELYFGSSVQETVSVLGMPQQKYYKLNDPLMILKRDKYSDESDPSDAFISSTHDYFFNYFKHGIDVLFDGKSHTIKKFILWTNMPTQPHFIVYAKCHFTIKDVKRDGDENVDGWKLDCDDKFEKIQKVLGETGSKPFVWSPSNTKFYGYQDIIFEVMKNSYVSRVILYKD